MEGIMEKMNGESKNIVAENIDKIKGLFPEVFTENKIDFERLQEVLGEFVEDKDERYRFEWHGKSKAVRLAQTPSTGTLRPCKEESKNWDTTENLYIEGDNLEVLKLLQKTYNNSIKMIYIDPPYNTGKDFVYPDNFTDNIKNYLEITGQIDEEGMKISTNSDSSGRYHTDWLNMMYPRLRLARNLLTDDGVIFISIDDTEVANLRKVCDEVYGETNFVSQIVWERAYAPVNLKRHFSSNHDHIICYAKNIEVLHKLMLPRSAEANARYKNLDNDSRGVWKSDNLSVGPAIEKNIYTIVTPSGREVLPPNGYSWRYSKEKLAELIRDNRIWFGESGNNVPSIKRFISEVKDGITPMTVWRYSEVGHTQDARKETKELFNDCAVFDYPKPVKLINRLVSLGGSTENSIVLDFFSGSATTAHAVMQKNVEDSRNRRFIMVQLPEETNNKSEAYKAGYSNICDIGKERICRAGDLILQDNHDKSGIENIDVGFKVFKLDSSNLKRWNPDYDNLEISLDDMVSNYVDDRTEEDVLYEVMLKYGVDLTYPIENEMISDKKVFIVGFGALFICLSDEIDSTVAEYISKRKNELKPEVTRVVFKDNGFADDSAKTNIIQTLKRNGIDEIVSV